MTTNLRFRGWSPSTKKMVACCSLTVHGKAVEDGYTWETQPTNDLIPLMWTGLNDADVVPIYEGDFIYTKVNQHFWVYCVSAVEGFGNSLKAVLIFDNVTSDGEQYTFEVRDHRTSEIRSVVDVPYGDEVYVVGNIYENSDYHPAAEYKKRCDEVLLSRGKSGRLPIPSGMSTEQLTEFLTAAIDASKTRKYSERPIEEHLGIKCQVFTRSDFDDWKETEAVCHRCHFNENVPWRCDEISCASGERPDNQSVFFIEMK